MHTKEEVELFLLARGDGMTLREAAAFAGVGMGAAKRWSAGDLPRSYTGRPWGSGRIGADEASATRGGARVKRIEIRGLYEPPETGPLAQMTSDQIEKLLLRAVLDDLKGGGSHPLSTPMRSRCELAGRLRRATGLPTSAITRFLEIPRSTWYYHRARAGFRRATTSCGRWWRRPSRRAAGAATGPSGRSCGAAASASRRRSCAG